MRVEKCAPRPLPRGDCFVIKLRNQGEGSFVFVVHANERGMALSALTGPLDSWYVNRVVNARRASALDTARRSVNHSLATFTGIFAAGFGVTV